MTVRIDIKEWENIYPRGVGDPRIIKLRRFTLATDKDGITLSEDEARRVWEVFAPYFDGREVERGMKPNPGKPELMDEFARWLERHGRTGVFVKTKPGGIARRNSDDEPIEFAGGGQVFIASGIVAPYMTTTINRFVETGRAVRVGNRVTLA